LGVVTQIKARHLLFEQANDLQPAFNQQHEIHFHALARPELMS